MHLGAASCELQVGGAAARQARGGFQEGGTNLGSIPRLPPSRPRRNSLWLAEWGRCGSQTRCGCAGGSLGTATPKGKGSNSPWAFWGGYPRKPDTEARKIAPKSANRDGKSRVSPNRFPGRKRAVINYRGRGAAGRGAPLLRGQRGLEEAGTDLNRFTPTPSPGQSLGSA